MRLLFCLVFFLEFSRYCIITNRHEMEYTDALSGTGRPRQKYYEECDTERLVKMTASHPNVICAFAAGSGLLRRIVDQLLGVPLHHPPFPASAGGKPPG